MASFNGPSNGHRVRAGLTGLAAIFLLVLAAAAGLRPDASGARDHAPGETLAVLGVAPGPGNNLAVRKATPPLRAAKAPLTRT